MIAPLLALGLALVPAPHEVSMLLPRFHAGVHAPVLVHTRTTGTVAPMYYREAELVVYGDGSWQATRSQPYMDPPMLTTVASGTLPLPRVQALVDMAFMGSPRFVDLPTEYPADLNRRPIGGGRRSLALHLADGTHAVTFFGQAPEPARRLMEALDTETRELSLE